MRGARAEPRRGEATREGEARGCERDGVVLRSGAAAPFVPVGVAGFVIRGLPVRRDARGDGIVRAVPFILGAVCFPERGQVKICGTLKGIV